MAASLPPISGNNLERSVLQDNSERLTKSALLRQASERFEKRSLLQFHDDLVSGSGGADCSVPLEKLRPISFTELQVGEVHGGRVVYGTLCAEAYRMCTIRTLLEDDNGLAVRLAIYDAVPFQADIKKLYPMGAKVAVKEPYLKIVDDGGFTIRVDNPANFVNLMTQKGNQTERLLHLDLEDMREEGNRCFREQNWVAAAEHYTKCIDAALLQLKENPSNSNVDSKIINGLLRAYSNRAETWLQLKEFKRALEDSNEAIRIDAGHLKALYRKGRALLGLRHYRTACECLEKANEANAGQMEIREALGRAKTLCAQSLNGKYDISDYLLGEPTSSPPEVADFVGNVEIKMTEDGRGRGLYATRKIRTGELLLVSNAVAVAYTSASATTASQDLVALVACEARKSQRLLRQLYSLHGSSTSSSLEVPAIDLFKTDGQMCEDQGEETENLPVDVNCIREIVTLNAFGAGKEFKFISKEKTVETMLFPQGESFNGLWLLPSFINHSCLPNSCKRFVGSAMFMHASKPIERGEEITVPYLDPFLPFPQRQARCKCRRCVLEHSLRKSLKPIITARFEQMHDQAQEELLPRRSGQLPIDVDLPASAAFAGLALEAERFIGRSQLSEEENNWIRASFMSAYLAGAQSKRFAPIIFNRCHPIKLMGAIQSTDPSDFRNFNLAMWLLKDCERCAGAEHEALIRQFVSDQVRDAYISLFGRHCENVFQALVQHYINGQSEEIVAVVKYVHGLL